MDTKHNAVKKISYHGIICRFEQGNKLLGKYNSEKVSVRDLDEYLARTVDKTDANYRYRKGVLKTGK